MEKDSNYFEEGGVPAWYRIGEAWMDSQRFQFNCELLHYDKEDRVIVKASVYVEDVERPISSAIVSRKVVDIPPEDRDKDPVGWANTVALGKALAFHGIGGQPGTTQEELAQAMLDTKKRIKVMIEKGDETGAQRIALGQHDPKIRRELNSYAMQCVAKKNEGIVEARSRKRLDGRKQAGLSN